MERIDALKELLAKVEAGCKYETMGHTLLCQRAFPKPDDFDGSRESYAKSNAQMAVLAWRNGSLDAAKALHDDVLPGWMWQVFALTDCDFVCVLDGPEFSTDEIEFQFNPARAWICSIIKALIAQEES